MSEPPVEEAAAPVAGWPARFGMISFSAPFVAMLITLVVTRMLGRTDTDSQVLVAGVNTVLFAVGFLLGLAGVVGSVRAGRRGWLIRAMVGTVLNAMALFHAAAVFAESGW